MRTSIDVSVCGVPTFNLMLTYFVIDIIMSISMQFSLQTLTHTLHCSHTHTMHTHTHTHTLHCSHTHTLHCSMHTHTQQADQRVSEQHGGRESHQQRQTQRVHHPGEPDAGPQFSQLHRLQHHQHWTSRHHGRKTSLGAWAAVADHQGEGGGGVSCREGGSRGFPFN